MSPYWRKAFAYFIPSAAALTLLWSAFSAFAVFMLLMALLGISSREVPSALLAVSCLGLPALAGLLFIAALLPMRAGPRAVLLFSVAVLLTLASFLGQAFTTGEAAGNNLLFAAICLLPGFLVTVIPGLFFTIRAGPEVRQVLKEARARRVAEVVHAHGDPALGEIAAELKLSQDQAARLLQEMVQQGELMGLLYRETGRFYSAASLAEKQRRLLAMVQARGKLGLEDAAAGLNVSPGQVHTWIYNLVQRGQFHGYVDWERQMVYALDASHQTEAGCPHCGGELDVAGQGLIHCRYCGVEIFL